MKLNQKSRDVLVGNEIRRGSFRLKEGRVLMESFSRIYEDPVWAVCRELTTNIYDAYMALPEEERNKRPKPIIKLPTRLSPNLEVIDFGVGLTHDEFEIVFITYGESTKGDTNEQLGAFGIGAKSPFALSGNFTVIVRKGGKKTVYACFKGEDEFEYSVQAEKETDEEDGVTVSVPIDPKDFGQVREGIARILEFFPMDVEVTGEGVEGFAPAKAEYIKEAEDGSWKIKTIGRNRESSRVIMGMVPYPVRSRTLIKNADGVSTQAVENLNVDIFVDVGAVDVPPDREGLEYTERTTKVLAKVFDNILDTLQKEAEEKIKGADSYWTAASRLISLSNELPLLNSYIKDIKWKGEKVDPWKGFEISVEELEKKFPGIEVETYSNPDHTLTISRTKDIEEIKLSPKSNHWVVYDDDGAPVTRTRHFVREQVSYDGYGSRRSARMVGKAYLVRGEDIDVDKLSEALYGIPVKLVSTLENPRAGSGTTSSSSGPSIVPLRKYENGTFDREGDVNLDDGGIYVRMNRSSVLDFPQSRLPDAIRILKELDILTEYDDIYGVPRSRSEVENRDEWVELRDYTEATINRMLGANAQNIADVESWVNHLYKGWAKFFARVSLRKLESGTFPYVLAQTIRRVDGLKRKMKNLRIIAQVYDLQITEKEPSDDVDKISKRIFKRYPMLQVIGTSSWSWDRYEDAVVEYIRLVEKSHN